MVRAAEGELPAWAAVADESRRRHLASVAASLDRWARDLGLSDSDRARWRAAGWLHDALRDAPPERFDPAVAPTWPALLRHGPAVAGRLAAERVQDAELLNALAYHSTGHPELGALGRFLVLADYLEPGRGFLPGWRAALRAQLPERCDSVLRQVAAARISHAVQRGYALLPETVAFWNGIAGGAGPGGASEPGSGKARGGGAG